MTDSEKDYRDGVYQSRLELHYFLHSLIKYPNIWKKSKKK